MEGSVPIKRKRVSAPKVRTGCKTCKFRKVKCDEVKPVCSRCQFAGHNCVYAVLSIAQQLITRSKELIPIKPNKDADCQRGFRYGPGGSSLFRCKHGILAPAARSLIPSLSTATPSFSVVGNVDEHRYFRVFHERIAIDLGGYFETPFWTCLVLRECHREPAIRHEIFALSALYISSTSDNDEIDRHRQFALAQQSKAIRCLSQSLSGELHQVRLALIASLILGSFESLHGNWETASQQIYHGRHLINCWDASKELLPKAKLPESLATVDSDNISVVLARLELQMETFRALNPLSSDVLVEVGNGDVTLGEIPNKFNTIEEALPSAINISMLTLQHMRRCTRYKSLMLPTAIPDSLKDERDAFKKPFDHWHKAFQPLLEKAGADVASRQHRGALMFHTCSAAFQIMSLTSSAVDETVFDKYIEQFEYIVRTARYILQKDEDLRKLSGPRIIFDMHLIMPLFYTATRCRVYSTRLEAVALLREWPSRNGIWDSLQVAAVAEWVATTEEIRRDECGLIREDCRVRLHTLKWSTRGKRINIECAQGSIHTGLKSHLVEILCQ